MSNKEIKSSAVCAVFLNYNIVIISSNFLPNNDTIAVKETCVVSFFFFFLTQGLYLTPDVCTQHCLTYENE